MTRISNHFPIDRPFSFFIVRIMKESSTCSRDSTSLNLHLFSKRKIIKPNSSKNIWRYGEKSLPLYRTNI